LLGFLLVDKPEGPTSHDVVDTVRWALKTKRVGHAGTLDPPASGLLVIGVGAATRLLRFVQELNKRYEATGTLGVRTTSLDAAGQVLETSPVDVSREQLHSALAPLRGKILQSPPAVSAVKVDGERAWKRTKRGEAVAPQAREVVVHELELTRFEPPQFDVSINCSSGTYVRSLIADAGDALGCGAHVSRLRRTAIGDLAVSDAVAPDAVRQTCLRPVHDVLRHLPAALVDADTERRALFGQSVEAPAPFAAGAEVLVLGPSGALGVFEARGDILRPVCVLHND
jgi:tRNA pseudouridine55 synthase